MKFRTIVNPAAGKGEAAENKANVREILRNRGADGDIVETSEAGDAYYLSLEAARRDFDRVLAVGGDGTVREVASGLANTDTELVIVPSGMGNDLARSLGIPREVKESTGLAFGDCSRSIDLCREGGRYYNVLGVGLPVEVMQLVNRKRRSPFSGPGNFLLSIIRVVFQLKVFGVELKVDGDRYRGEALAVFVLNSPYTGGGLKMLPAAKMDDGLLNAVVIEEVSRRELLAQLPRVYRGDHTKHPKFRVFEGKAVEIETEGEHGVIKDGDLLSDTPISTEIAPGALKVVVPPDLSHRRIS